MTQADRIKVMEAIKSGIYQYTAVHTFEKDTDGFVAVPILFLVSIETALNEFIHYLKGVTEKGRTDEC